MDIFETLEAEGFVFVLVHQHTGEKTVCLMATQLSRTGFIEAAGQEIIIGRIDERDQNHVYHFGTLKSHMGVINAMQYIANGSLTEILQRFDARVTQKKYDSGSYWRARD